MVPNCHSLSCGITLARELYYDFISTYTNRTAHCGDGAIDARNVSSNACDNVPANSRSRLVGLAISLAVSRLRWLFVLLELTAINGVAFRKPYNFALVIITKLAQAQLY